MVLCSWKAEFSKIKSILIKLSQTISLSSNKFIFQLWKINFKHSEDCKNSNPQNQKQLFLSLQKLFVSFDLVNLLCEFWLTKSSIFREISFLLLFSQMIMPHNNSIFLYWYYWAKVLQISLVEGLTVCPNEILFSFSFVFRKLVASFNNGHRLKPSFPLSIFHLICVFGDVNFEERSSKKCFKIKLIYNWSKKLKKTRNSASCFSSH